MSHKKLLKKLGGELDELKKGSPAQRKLYRETEQKMRGCISELAPYVKAKKRMES